MDPIDIQRIIGEVAVKHGFAMDGHDPSFALVTINQLVFEDLIRQASEQISARVAEFNVSLGQLEERIGKVAAQEVATVLRTQLGREIQAGGHEWKQELGAGKRAASLLNWTAIAIAAAVIFLLGVWTGQFSVLVASHLR